MVNVAFFQQGLFTVLNYTTLKHKSFTEHGYISLFTVLNYTTLKPGVNNAVCTLGLFTVLNYTTLKPQILRKRPTKRMPFNTAVLF